MTERLTSHFALNLWFFKSIPLLGSGTIQQMDLIQVRFENILSIVSSSHKEPLTKEQLVNQFPDVFQGTRKLR